MKTTLHFSIISIFLLITSPLLAQGPGKSLILDGNNDYVECSTNNRGITSSVTAEAWVKTGSWVYHWVVGKYDRDAQGGFHLIIKDGKAAFAGRDGSGVYKNSGYSSVLVNDNQWHHLAGVCDNGTWRIYVDGVLQNQLVSGYTSTDLTSTAMMAIGKDFLANNENYNGQVDEIRVWKRALSEAEIRQNMCQKILPSANGLVAYFNLDEGVGSTIQDLSPSKINGTFRNMNAATAWTVSGAPIGDKSVYLYPISWLGQELSMVAPSSIRLAVTSASTALKGMHIYTISSKPAATSGIEKPEQVADYFGTFKVGSSLADYTLKGEQVNAGCFNTMFRRQDNTVSTWNKIATATQPDALTYTSAAAQNEITLNTSIKAKISGKSSFCAGSSTTLTLNTSGAVLWNTGETATSIQVSEAGNYSVAINENGCTYTDELIVTEIPVPDVNLGEDKILCYGEKLTLTAPMHMKSYRWSTGETTPTIEVSATGTYGVEVVNEGGCTSGDEISITVKPAPAITLLQEQSVCYGEAVILNATTPDATSYLWSNGQTTANITVTAPAELSVSITVNGCSFVRQVKVLSDECPVIPNIITPNGDSKNDTFVLKGINIDNINIQIFNRWGKRIYQGTGYKNDWSTSVDGLYFYHIKSGQTQKDYKGWVEVLK